VELVLVGDRFYTAKMRDDSFGAPDDPLRAFTPRT
jgi:hypothetical protein